MQLFQVYPHIVETIFLLSAVLFGLSIIGYIEFRGHKNSLSKIPIRIHINGTRGKSSVTRLIAAGLRAGGIKTFAKTTGSSPRFIDENGNDHIIQRFRPASIGEQIRMITRFSKSKPEAIVMECMAVQPEYQWVSEHRIIQSNYSVITNVRPDHLEDMGFSLRQIAKSLCNTIPYNKKVFTSEDKMLEPIVSKSIENNNTIDICMGKDLNTEYLSGFSFIEHPDNVALALGVCESVGVDRDCAIKGMRKTPPDPGALTMLKLKIGSSKIDFVNAFAANDPESTLKTWKIIDSFYQNKKKIAIFLNTRSDRQLRTQQLLDLIYNEMKPDQLIIRGDNLKDAISTRSKEVKNIACTVFNEEESATSIINKLSEMNDYLVIGIGNIVGWGDNFIKEIRRLSND